MRKNRLPKVTIRGSYYGHRTMPSLNDYIDAISAHKDAEFKTKYTKPMLAAIKRCLHGWRCTDPPVILHYKFYEVRKGKRRDVSNIFSLTAKFFEDALVTAGVLEDDNPDWIKTFDVEFHYLDSDEPYIEVSLEQIGKGE